MNDRRTPMYLVIAVLSGLVSIAGMRLLDGFIVNVVSYKIMESTAKSAWLAYVVGLITAVGLLFVLPLARSDSHSLSWGGDRSASGRIRFRLVFGWFSLLIMAGTAIGWHVGLPLGFVTICVFVMGITGALDVLGGEARLPRSMAAVERLAPWLLLAAISASTLFHAREQISHWKQFALGYADFGFFTTDLEHCLPWKEVGPHRFSDIRMGYHCIPFFYLLVPIYAAARSPTFLMYVGPLALNLAAIPFFQLARERSRSATIGLLVGLAWLLLPSLARLPYSNTYGFQNIYLAVPWLAWSVVCAMRGWWKSSHCLLIMAVLCEETVCGVSFGWGAYLCSRGDRRRDGIVIMIASVAYLLLATCIIIPAFTPSGRYTRLDLFGDISPATIFERLGRPQVYLYALALIVPMIWSALRSPGVLLAVAPTLLLVWMLKWHDYLSIKFWHQSSMLPFLFVAAVLGATAAANRGDRESGGSKAAGSPSLGPPLALLIGALLFHYLMGNTPISKAWYERLARVAAVERPAETRTWIEELNKTVDFVRDRFPSESTALIATQRLAAHFIDYQMVLPANDAEIKGEAMRPDVFVFDRRDGWDELVANKKLDSLIERLKSGGYEIVRDERGIVVLAGR